MIRGRAGEVGSVMGWMGDTGVILLLWRIPPSDGKLESVQTH